MRFCSQAALAAAPAAPRLLSQCSVLVGALVSCALLTACGGDDQPVPPDESCKFRLPVDDTPTPAIHTPRWAFEPWISKDISSTDDTYEFVKGFRDRDIPVGVVVLDSPWETHYNTFVPNPDRYHDFDKLVADLHADDIRVVLWTTQMVNVSGFDVELGGDIYQGPAANYEEGLNCGFYVNDGAGYGWWKGVGAGLDFFNPEAQGWWHRQQDPLFDVPIDGYKLDFGENYIQGNTLQTAAGEVSHQQYSEAYYEDFLRYGVAKRGAEDFVTMVRPYDKSYGFEGRFFARPEHAPTAWVGDNRRDWVGMEDALDHIFRSAAAGYAVVGSDIGGYLDVDDTDFMIKVPFDTLVFDRWSALGALMPFMQLHGRANITPWTVPDTPEQTVDIYRYWATLHHELVPFFYSLAELAHAGGEPIMRPIGAESSWPGDYRYMLGEALLVAPILDASGIRDVSLPAGARWYDWWRPADDALDGGQSLADYDVGGRERLPLFVRDGAIIALEGGSPVTGLGTAASAGALTVLIYPAAQASSFSLHEQDGETTMISASGGAAGSDVTLSRVLRTTLLRVRADVAPAAVMIDGQPAAESADRAALDAAADGYWYNAANRDVWVKLGAGASGSVMIQ